MLQAVASKRFQILRRLGEGGMGEVYEALDAERGERVALKVLRNTTADSLVRFKREFRALQDLHHPNLVTLGELVNEDDRWFFTMELVNGVDFVSWVRSMPPPPIEGETTLQGKLADKLAAEAMAGGFDEGRLRAALLQLTHALGTLHAAQKIHRDVKPSNVLVTPDGRVVVLDFGLVTEEQGASLGTTTEVAVVGTPAYMAPEQAASKPVTAAADWYAVGVLLYETMTGRMPFAGAPLEILLAKQTREPDPASSLVPGLPPDLDGLCTRLLHFDPTSRADEAQVLRVLDKSTPRGPRTTGTATQAATFVGRAAELEALRVAFGDARTKRGVIVLVHGESGIGKSWLVRSFADEMHLREHDLVVLAGRCFERESVPYKAFDGVVDALSRFMSRLPHGEALALLPTRPASLAQLFPVLKRVEAVAQAPLLRQEVLDPLELRSRGFAGLREVFTRLADRRPVIVTIDDLQWADADSIALLAEVMRPPEAPNLMLVATLRDGSDESTAVVRNTLDLAQRLPGDVRHVHVGPLSAAHSRELARALIERTAPELPVSIDAIAGEAGGHPLFIDEIVRHLFHVGAPATSTLRLDDALWSRVEALDDRARRLVELVAVAGTPVAQDALALALDAAPGEFAKLTSFLRVAHLVKTSGSRGTDTIEPYHSRVRSAVLANLDLAATRAHHRKLAIALESSGSADEEAMAAHWEGGGHRENASKHMLKAAEQASETLAFDRAAKLYERALALRSESTTRLDRDAERAIERKWADALAMAGRGALAAKAYRAAAVGANAAEALDLERRAAEQLLRSGHFDKGLHQVRQVLRSVGLPYPSTPRRALLAILLFRLYFALRGLGFRRRDESEISARDLTRIDVCWTVAFSLSMVDTIRANFFQHLHFMLALRIGEGMRVARAKSTEIAFVALRGTRTFARATRLYEETQREANASGNPHAIAWAKATMGIASYLAGRFSEALPRLRESEALFRSEVLGSTWEMFMTRHFALQSLANLGRIKELCAEQPATLRECIDRGDLHGAVNLRIGYPNLVWLVSGHADMARRQCADAIREWAAEGFHLEHYYALMAMTNIDLYEGRGRAALDRALADWPALERSLVTRVQFVRIQTLLVRARATLAAAGESKADREPLVASALRDGRRVLRQRAAWAEPHVTLLRAGGASLRGRDAEARALLERARGAFHANGNELMEHVARAALGVRVGGDEGRSEAKRAEEWMRGQTIQKPARFVAMLAPGVLERP
jgi:hypothetical protein